MAQAPARLTRRTEAERDRLVDTIAQRVDVPMTVLGVVFVLVVLGQATAHNEPAETVLAVASWVLWAAFAAEFALRFAVAPSKTRFLRRNWWQIAFLVVPFLRFLRVAAALRTLRIGRVLSSAVRGTRSAGRLLTSRLGWLAAVTVIVILSASQLLYGFETYDTYGSALHDAALATIAGEPTGEAGGVAHVLDVVLAVYSVVVFASLAGMLGAYFLRRADDRDVSHAS